MRKISGPDHIHPDDRAAAVDYCLQASREKSQYAFEYRMVAADGRIVWIYDIVSTVMETGELKALRGVMLDITERKRTEEALRRSNEQVTTVVEQLTDAFLSVDRDWNVTYVNHAAERMLGRDRMALLGQDLRTACPGSAVLWTHCTSALAQNAPVYFETHDPMSGRWFGTRAYPSADGMAIFQADMTERKAAEERIERLNQELQQRVHEFETLINTVPIGIGVSTDASCSYIWGNREFNRMLGCSQEGNLSKSASEGPRLPFRVFRDGREVQPHDLPMQRACREARDMLDEELEIVRADGTTLYELSRATPLHDEQGRVRGCIGAFLDITERKRAEQVVREREQALKESEQRLKRTIDDLGQSRSELQDRVKELELFHDLVVDRELRMIELEREIARLTPPGSPA